MKTTGGKVVQIFTDGGCIPNPGRGGWAVLMQTEGGEKQLSGFEEDTTNNRMELTAAIKALEFIDHDSRAVVFTDSEYVRKGITEWLPNWRSRGWKRKGGTLANQDLWMELDELTRHKDVEWRWVKGHAGHSGNERVDSLVRQAIQKRGR